MNYSKELLDVLVSLSFEPVPASAISEVILPSDLDEAYVKLTPNGKIIVTPCDDNKIGNPSTIYFVSSEGVESKFIPEADVVNDIPKAIAELSGYSKEDEESKSENKETKSEDEVVLKSEDEDKNKEAEEDGKSIVERYASVDATPIINRVSLYSKLHPENDYTEILTLLQGAKNMPQIEEIQKEHELIFPKMLITGPSHSEALQAGLDDIYNPHQASEVLPPIEPEVPPIAEYESRIAELEAQLDAEKTKNLEAVDIINKLGDKISDLTSKLDDVLSKLDIKQDEAPAVAVTETVPAAPNLAGYGATLKAISNLPMEGVLL